MGYEESDTTEVEGAERPIPSAAIGCFPDRLKKAMGANAARAFSRKCGLSEGALRSYLSGDTYPTLDRLEQIAGASGVTAMWLAFGVETEADRPADDEKYAYVPLYDAKISAGHGAWSEGATVLTHLAFTRYSLRKKGLDPKNLSAVRIDGDSNEPLLSDGDTVMIDHSRNTAEGEAFYVILLDHHLYAKRLQRQINGGLAVISANPAYQTMTVDKDKLADLQIIGRVVWNAEWMI